MSLLGLTSPQAHALATLHQAMDTVERAGCIIPCKLNPEGWLPEGSPIRAREAIEWCQACPVLDQCRAYADTHPLPTHDVAAYRGAAVLGGQWWSGDRLLNPYPIRKRGESRTCKTCGRKYNYRGDRHKTCRPCRNARTKQHAGPPPAAPVERQCGTCGRHFETTDRHLTCSTCRGHARTKEIAA